MFESLGFQNFSGKVLENGSVWSKVPGFKHVGLKRTDTTFWRPECHCG